MSGEVGWGGAYSGRYVEEWGLSGQSADKAVVTNDWSLVTHTRHHLIALLPGLL